MAKLAAVVVTVALIMIVVFSPGLLGVQVTGGEALETAFGIALLFGSLLALGYACYAFLFRTVPVPSARELQTPEELADALYYYRSKKVLSGEVNLALDQLTRIRKRKDALTGLLDQRFTPGELSHRKFMSVITEVEQLFYLNIRNVLNKLGIYTEAELSSLHATQGLAEERVRIYNEFLSFVQRALRTNEEILLDLEKLLLEISRLDSLEPQDIENMACMQEIDALIKSTKLYK